MEIIDCRNGLVNIELKNIDKFLKYLKGNVLNEGCDFDKIIIGTINDDIFHNHLTIAALIDEVTFIYKYDYVNDYYLGFDGEIVDFNK